MSALENDEETDASIPAPEMDEKTLFLFLSASISNRHSRSKKSFRSIKKELVTNHEVGALRAIYTEQYHVYKLFIHLTTCFPDVFHYDRRSMLLNAAEECWRDLSYFAGDEVCLFSIFSYFII